MAIHAGELAAQLNGKIEGDSNIVLTSIAQLESAGSGAVVYVDSVRHLDAARASAAGLFIVSEETRVPGKTCLVVAQPRLAFARAVALLVPERPVVDGEGVHPTAVVDPSAQLGEGVAVGACAVIEAGAVIGRRTQIGAGCCVGREVAIGEDCVLFPRVTLYPGVKLGARVRVHSGAVIGSDGFGYVPTGEGWEKFPQRGTVVIEDDVEIGANSTIDRATLGETRIGRGVKIDNLVHVAHNVAIGEHSVLAAMAGIAGSSTLGKRVVAGGQAGVADHCRIGDGAVLTGQTAVQEGKSIAAGETVFGNPARPLREFRKYFPYLSRLPELAKRIKTLEEKQGS